MMLGVMVPLGDPQRVRACGRLEARRRFPAPIPDGQIFVSPRPYETLNGLSGLWTRVGRVATCP